MAWGDIIAGVGNTLGLPEYGISEFFGGTPTPRLSDPNAGRNYQNIQQGTGSQNIGPYLPSANNPIPTITGNNYGPNLPSGGSGTPPPTNNNNNNGVNPNDLFNQQVNYYNQMYGDLLNNLEPQRQSQENVATNNFRQAQSDLEAARTQGLNDLNIQRTKTESGTVKTLKDLTENLRNQTTAGQVYLGARGAGDSSAANQYAFALAKEGNRARAGVLNQQASIFGDIGNNEAKLNAIHQQEMGKLETEKNNAFQQIASWYADAQNQIRMAKGQNIGQLSQQALQYALQSIQDVNNRINNQRDALNSWALSNSQNIQQAKQNIAGAAQYLAPMIQAQGINGQVAYGGGGGSFGPAVGYGATEKRDIFGNIIR